MNQQGSKWWLFERANFVMTSIFWWISTGYHTLLSIKLQSGFECSPRTQLLIYQNRRRCKEKKAKELKMTLCKPSVHNFINVTKIKYNPILRKQIIWKFRFLGWQGWSNFAKDIFSTDLLVWLNCQTLILLK